MGIDRRRDFRRTLSHRGLHDGLEGLDRRGRPLSEGLSLDPVVEPKADGHLQNGTPPRSLRDRDRSPVGPASDAEEEEGNVPFLLDE